MSKWSKLEESVGQTVTLKGFLYQSDEGAWILSDQPNLKSCCLEKADHKVLLSGAFPKESSKRAICLQGTLSSKALDMQPYTLKDVTLVQGRPFPSFTILIAVGITIAFWLLRKVKKRPA